MGQKVNPIGLRLKINRMWDSLWFAGRSYADTLAEDMELRRFLQKRLKNASLARILIERTAKKPRITLFTARPGLIIGKKGADIEKLKGELSKMTSNDVTLNIVEVRKPEVNATLVAEGIAQQLERRVAFRRAMKRAMQNAMRLGALGIRINVAGRLNGADIARMTWYREGQVPLHSLRANIDYGFKEAKTPHGILGIKVWIYHGQTWSKSSESTLQDKPVPSIANQ